MTLIFFTTYVFIFLVLTKVREARWFNCYDFLPDVVNLLLTRQQDLRVSVV